MTDTPKTDDKKVKLPKDKKKKKEILVGGGIVGVLLVAFIYYEHRKNATAATNSTTTTADGTTGSTGTSGWSGFSGSGYGGSGGGNTTGSAPTAASTDDSASLDAINSDFSTLNSTLAQLVSLNPGSAGGTTTATPVSTPNQGAGISGILTKGVNNVSKKTVTSAGNAVIAGVSATSKPVKIVTNPGGGTDAKAAGALAKAQAAVLAATKSGNKNAITNATKNETAAAKVVASRNANAVK